MKKKITQAKISVCVPTYNRPDTVKQLIHSFLKQDYPNTELVISDDSSNIEVKKVVMSFKSDAIAYYKNTSNVGFAHNLRTSILKATGDFLIILGDDDVLLNKKALSKYVEVFTTHQDVYYVYANQVQFSEDRDIEYEINMFPENQYFAAGHQTLEKLWLTSIFIGGLGLRNDKKMLKKFYPEEKILHPQVELAGHVMMNHASYVLKDNFIGFRSRDNQFIFKALTDKKIRKVGKHQNTELFEIYTKLAKKYKFSESHGFLNQRFIKDAMILYPKEKMILGNELLLANYQAFCAASEAARSSLKLKLILYFSLLVPAPLIFLMRRTLFLVVQFLHRELFSTYKKQLETAIQS